MRKTRDLVKKAGDIKGTCHTRMGKRTKRTKTVRTYRGRRD